MNWPVKEDFTNWNIKIKSINPCHCPPQHCSQQRHSNRQFIAWFVISNSSIHWMSTWTVLLCHCQSGIHKSQHNLHQPMPITPPSQSMKFDVMKTFIWLFSNLHLWCCHQICSPIYSVDLVDDHCLWCDLTTWFNLDNRQPIAAAKWRGWQVTKKLK